jgi:hypothetical protein
MTETPSDKRFKGFLHITSSLPFVTVGDNVWMEWVDRENRTARLLSNPITNRNYKPGDLVRVDLDDEGDWHVTGKVGTA